MNKKSNSRERGKRWRALFGSPALSRSQILEQQARFTAYVEAYAAELAQAEAMPTSELEARHDADEAVLRRRRAYL